MSAPSLKHPMPAPTLAVELRETVVRWFSARGTPAMQSSEVILAALADLAAEQIAANPTHEAQMKVFQRFIQDIFRGLTAATRRRLRGMPVTTVKQ